MDGLSLEYRILLWLVPVYLAVSVHELAHGITALYFGDSTASEQGRLTLNPLKHLDPVGSLIVPALLLFTGHFVFGWARAVPVDVNRLENPKRDMIFVVAAGPLSNLLMSIAWALAMKLGLWLLPVQPAAGSVLIYSAAAGILINTAIMMFNLLPMLPLDGGRILASLLPDRLARQYARTEVVGFPLLLVAVYAGIAGKVVWPLMVFGMALATWLTDVPVQPMLEALRILLGNP